jgi:hypothetical protein
MVDRGLVGGNWLQLPAGAYSLVPEKVRAKL